MSDSPFPFEPTNLGLSTDEPPEDKLAVAAEIRSRRRQRQTKMLAAFFLLPVLFASWWTGLNILQLRDAQVPELTLTLEMPEGIGRARFEASLDWYAPSEIAAAARPRVLIEGTQVEPAEAATVTLFANQPVKLAIEVSGDTERVTHVGVLRLELVDGPHGYPAALEVPVEAEVFGGVFSRSWSTARWGVVGAAVLFGCLYCLCLLAVPKPKGSFVLLVEGVETLPANVRAAPGLGSLFRPWGRANVPFRRLLKRGKIEELKSIRARLLFIRGDWPRLLPMSAAGWQLERGALGQVDLDQPASNFVATTDSSILERRVYRLRRETDGRSIRFRYSSTP